MTSKGRRTIISSRPSIIIAALVWLSGGFASEPALGWEVLTHRVISQEAINASNINQVLRESLGLENGLSSPLRDDDSERSIEQWIGEGSRREDDFPRFLNHFHHPLRSWGQAGLNDFFSGESSAVWAQTVNQSALSDSWSWQETRNRYYLALTSQTKEDRDRYLAQTFRGLGHQIHLIQDVASVPHARNKAHLIGFNIEKWTDQFRRSRTGEFTQVAIPLALSCSLCQRPKKLFSTRG